MKRQWIEQAALLLLRVVAGLMFSHHGFTKLLGWFGGAGGSGGTVPLLSQAGIGGALELVGGILIMLGLFTRPVAFILAGEMAVAYWQFHAPQALWPIVNKGELAALYCFIFLYMAARGGGEYSLDALIFRKRAAHSATG